MIPEYAKKLMVDYTPKYEDIYARLPEKFQRNDNLYSKVRKFETLADIILNKPPGVFIDNFMKEEEVDSQKFYIHKPWLAEGGIINMQPEDSLDSQIKYEFLRKDISPDEVLVNKVRANYSQFMKKGCEKKKVLALALLYTFRDRENPLPARAGDYHKLSRKLMDKLGLSINYDKMKLIENITDKWGKDYQILPEIVSEAKNLINENREKITAYGFNPFSCSAAAIYKASINKGLPMVRNHVAEMFGVSPKTIGNMMKKIFK